MSDSSLYFAQSNKPTPEELGTQIDEEKRREGEYDPTSEGSFNTRNIVFPSVVNDRITQIEQDGPKTVGESDELLFVHALGKAEQDGVTPEIMSEEIKTTTAITTNLGRLENDKTTESFRDKVNNQQFENTDGEVMPEVFQTAATESIALLGIYSQGKNLGEGFEDLTVVQEAYARGLMDRYQELKARKNNIEGTTKPIVMSEVMSEVFEEMFGQNLPTDIQTPFGSTTETFLPNGEGSLSEAAKNSIGVLRDVHKEEDVTDTGDAPLYTTENIQSRDQVRETIDAVYQMYQEGGDVENSPLSGHEIMNNRIATYENTNLLVSKAIEEFKSGTPSDEIDYQYLASMLNNMGITDIDISKPFSAADIPMYIEKLSKAQEVLSSDVDSLYEAKLDVVSPARRYERMVGRHVGAQVGKEFTTATEVNTLINDVLMNPGNYSDGARLKILTTYNMATEAFADILAQEEVDTKFVTDLDAFRRNRNMPSNATSAKNSVFMFFGADESARKGFVEGHPTMQTLATEAYEFWDKAYGEIFTKVLEETGIENVQAPSLMAVLQLADPNWTFGNDIPWDKIDDTNMMVLTEMLVQESSKRNLKDKPDILNSLDGYFQSSMEIMTDAEAYKALPIEEKIKVAKSVKLMTYLLDTGNLFDSPQKKTVIRDLLTGNAPKEQIEKRMRAITLFARELKKGGGNIFASVDFAAIAQDPTSDEAMAVLAEMETVYTRSVDRIQGYVGKLYKGSDLITYAKPATMFGTQGKIYAGDTAVETLQSDLLSLGLTDNLDDEKEVEILRLTLQNGFGANLTKAELQEVDSYGYTSFGENQKAVTLMLNGLFRNPEERAIYNTAYAALNSTGERFSIVDVLELAGFGTAKHGDVTIGSNTVSQNVPPGKTGLIPTNHSELPKGVENIPPLESKDEWEDKDDFERVSTLYSLYNGPTAVSTPEQQEQFQRNAAVLYMHTTGNDIYEDNLKSRFPTYIGKDEEGNDVLRKGDDKEAKRTLDTFLNRQLDRRTYEAVDVSWAGSPETKTILQQNFNVSNNPYLFKMAAAAKIKPEEFQEQLNGIIEEVQRDYSSNELMIELYDKAMEARQELGFIDYFHADVGLEPFMRKFKPTLLDLNVEVLVRMEELLPESYTQAAGYRPNIDRFGGGSPDILTTVRRYPDVKMSFNGGNRSLTGPARPDGMNAALYRIDANGKRVGEPINVAWAFTEEAKVVYDNPTWLDRDIKHSHQGSRNRWGRNDLGRLLAPSQKSRSLYKRDQAVVDRAFHFETDPRFMGTKHITYPTAITPGDMTPKP